MSAQTNKRHHLSQDIAGRVLVNVINSEVSDSLLDVDQNGHYIASLELPLLFSLAYAASLWFIEVSISVQRSDRSLPVAIQTLAVQLHLVLVVQEADVDVCKALFACLIHLYFNHRLSFRNYIVRQYGGPAMGALFCSSFIGVAKKQMSAESF